MRSTHSGVLSFARDMMHEIFQTASGSRAEPQHQSTEPSTHGQRVVELTLTSFDSAPDRTACGGFGAHQLPHCSRTDRSESESTVSYHAFRGH